METSHFVILQEYKKKAPLNFQRRFCTGGAAFFAQKSAEGYRRNADKMTPETGPGLRRLLPIA
jgi:hypothetical protein